MNTKGFIFALGRWSSAYQPLSIHELTAIPPILYSLHLMISAGISKILICAAPDDAAQIHSILENQLWEAKISYLLAEKDTNVTNAIVSAAEFFEQSFMLLMGAGVYCIGRDYSNRLKSNLKGRRGLTAFRMRSGMSGEDWMIPELLLLDFRTRKMLADVKAGSIEDLRKRCLTRVKYFEMQLPEHCLYINLVYGMSLRASARSDCELIKKTKTISEMTVRSTTA